MHMRAGHTWATPPPTSLDLPKGERSAVRSRTCHLLPLPLCHLPLSTASAPWSPTPWFRRVGALLAALLLAGCGVAAPPAGHAARPAGPAPAEGDPAHPRDGEPPVTSGEAPPVTEPQGGAQPSEPQGPSAGKTPPESPAGEPPAASPVRWYQKAPGYPLTTDDPAARGRKVAMLTFDDGPNPGTTEQILDVLKQYNVRAVFFVTGYGARHTDLLRRIAAEGHIIGTHTMTHANLRELSREEQRREIVGVNEMVEAATGQKVRYFRPPFGAYNEDTLALMEELGLELINWSHGSRDWVGVANGWKDPALVVRDVLAEEPPDSQATRLHPGAIILLHDTLPHTAAALPAILEGLAEKGYELVTLAP